MNVSKKQKEIIQKMRDGIKLFTINGFDAKACTSDNTKVSLPTVWKLSDLKLISAKKEDWRSTIYQLTELGETIHL